MQQTEFTRTFYWFDFETFGLCSRRDRPAQFAGIRSDESMNPIGKPDVFYCLPADDYLPSPQSCRVTGITPMTCLEKGEPEAVFASRIYDRLGAPGTIAVGYNNIAFDDEFTRFMFWRNLIDPYQREWGQGRARMDLYRVVQALYVFKPEALIWPKDENGKISMKLEKLTKANGILHDAAHDASSDAVATMLLAKLIKQKEPKFWDYAVSLTQKDTLKELLNGTRALLYASRDFGWDRNFLAPIYPLGQNPNKSNEWFCWDLNKDPEELLNLTLDDIRNPEDSSGGKRFPFIKLKLTTAPFIVPVPRSYDAKFAAYQDVSYEQIQERAKKIAHSDLSIMGSLYTEIAEAEAEKFARTDEDFESSLYSIGFLNDLDRRLIEDLRKRKPAEIAESFNKLQFINEELTDMLRRYVARNYPEYLSAEDAKIWIDFKTDHLIGGKDQARTFEKFFAEIEKERAEFPEKAEIFEELYDYGQELLSEYQ